MKKNKIFICIIILLMMIVSISAQGYKDGQVHPVSANEVVYAETYGVTPNDNIDDSDALISALDYVKSIGSPTNHVVLQLPAGTIILSKQIRVEASGVIIKGTGNDPDNGGTKILVKLWEAYSVTSENEPDINSDPNKLWPGLAVFRVETSEDAGDNIPGSVNFPWKGVNVPSTGGGKTGDNYVTVSYTSKFSVGQTVLVAAADDEEWYEEHYIPEEYQRKQRTRTQMFKIVSIDGYNLYLDKPLEFDVPYRGDYNSKVVPMKPVSEVGFMDFYMEASLEDTQYYNTCNPDEYDPVTNPGGVAHRYQNAAPAAALHSILFKGAENCWVDNLHIYMSGSHAIVTEFARYITIENNTCNGSWNKGKGGHGYFRGSKLYDSLIQNNILRNLRHLAIQWSATGNIIKNNDIDCDLNVHGGWERNNLFINNNVRIPFEHRSWTEEGPEDETWYPIWWAAAPHASAWSSPSGYNNRFANNTLIKQKTEGAAFENWGFYDEPGKIYIFAGDSDANWDHLKTDGIIIPTWDPEICFYQYPNTGVTVSDYNGGNESPTVSITNPSNNDEFNFGEDIYISADADDSDGNIVKVEFYDGSTKLGEDTTSPYEYIWNTAPLGSHTLTAKAYDNDGASATSIGVLLTVIDGSNIAPTVSLTSPSEGDEFTEGDDINITADADDEDGNIEKVEFYAGTVKIGEDTDSPYEITWISVSTGEYALTAKAYDNDEASTVSVSVNITVNPAAITEFAVPGKIEAEDYHDYHDTTSGNTGGEYREDDVDIELCAEGGYNVGWIAGGEWLEYNINVSETSDYDISLRTARSPSGDSGLHIKIDGSDVTGTITVPSTGDWQTYTTINKENISLSSGSHTLTIYMEEDSFNVNWIDIQKSVTTENQSPTVNITSPPHNSDILEGNDIEIIADADDADGDVIQVQFYRDNDLIGTDTSAPYSVMWNNVSAGSYNLTAIATDNDGASTTSSIVNVMVLGNNNPPTVSITSPANNDEFEEGDNITITADADDTDGDVVKVEFYRGSTKLGEDTSIPYSYIWNNVPAGEYTITARAYDNDNAVKISDGVPIKVNGSSTSDVSVDYNIANDWGSGFTANITITNNSDQPINGWTLEFDFSGNQQITNSWSSTTTQNGNHVTSVNAGYNGMINPGQSVSYGFNASYSGINEKPSSFILNGNPVE